jgi:ADP-ribosylglycohydrolase
VAEKGFGRNGHGSMRWYYEGAQSMEQIRAFQRERQYPGNAPPMRAVPLGFLPSERINAYAIINADATHPHPKARAASILVARATEFLLCKQGLSVDLISYCLAHMEGIDNETSDLLLQVGQLPPPAELSDAHYEVLCGPQPIVAPRFLPGIYGLPSDAMLTGCCILYVLKHAQDAFDGLKIAVGFGGDVDSLASVCCGILSARYGLETLPAFMIAQVEGLVYLNSVGDRMEAAIAL